MRWVVAGAAAGAALLVMLALVIVVPFVDTPSYDTVPLAADAQVPAAYRPAIEQAAASCDGVTAPVLASQLRQESGWSPDAVSPVGAIGLAQFMPGTWAAWGVDGNHDGSADPRDPIDAIWSAARYDCALRSEVARIAGDAVQLTLAAYNAGPYAVLQYAGIPPFAETQSYVRAILGALPNLTAPQGPNGDGLTPSTEHAKQVVEQTFGITDSDIYGFARSGHGDVSDHYTGHAFDVMLLPRGPANEQLGWRIAFYLESNAQALNIKYLIWDDRIWNPLRAAEGWRVYTAPGGAHSPTLDHLDHVHVSVN